jgi:UDP-N-acetylglucosamine--N-acetylmuramyl-(pentapeptide) pyrophosphoryl-undecaprenol N-acetylglucosamine transferase
VGRSGSIEERIVKRESDLPFRDLPAAAVRGRGPLALIQSAITTGKGVLVAQRLISELKPAAILGTGGYVCVPLFLAARAMGVPTLIYLPDVVPGLAIKFLVRLATKVACQVEDSRAYLAAKPANIIVTGYPVRSALFQQDRAACRAAFGLNDALPVVLVYGGSLGARSINRAIEALLPQLLEHCQLIHICGREGDEEWLRAAAERLPEGLRGRYRLFPYLEAETRGSGGQPQNVVVPPGGTPGFPAPPAGSLTIARAFGAAELAICRSGASTMAELPAAGLPAILVPYPYVHQEENADYLVRHGAALKVADGNLLAHDDPRNGALYQMVIRLLTDKHERQRMAECSRGLARPDAARALATALLGLATRSLS